MPKQAKSKGKKIGRDKIKCAEYRRSGVREKHKLKRILASNGLAAFNAYALKHGLSSYARTLIKPETANETKRRTA